MRQWTVDAFASRPFMGNPAAVLEPVERWPADSWMQAMAAENKHAETAFLRRTGDPARFDLRWFTPAVEVPLCGHATLASAHVLFSELGVDAAEVAFDTRWSGRLGVTRSESGYRIDLPAAPSRPVETPPGLTEALGGVAPRRVSASRFLLVELEDEAAVRALRPDIGALAAFGHEPGSEGGNVIVTARADKGRGYAVVSRFFAPGCGIAEDPATGAAHCVLAPYWSERLGRARLDFHQAFPGRGAEIGCELAGDRVLVSGRAVTMLESCLRIAVDGE